MNEVGYKQYPGADYLDGKYEYHVWRGCECLIVNFLTDDDPNSCLTSTCSAQRMLACVYVEVLPKSSKQPVKIMDLIISFTWGMKSDIF